MDSNVRLTIRWKRPGMRRDVPTKLYDGDAGIACVGPNPGASAQDRYTASLFQSRRVNPEQSDEWRIA